MQVTVIGPTGSGKTMYLAALLRAAFSVRRASRPMVVRADPRSAAAVALDDSATALLCGRSVPATSAVSLLEFFVDLPGSRLFGIGKESMRLSMVDVPGGGCMPAPGCEVDALVVQSMAASDALLVVVPAAPAARPADFTERLRHIISLAVKTRRQRQTFAFTRIAVVLTMAELLVADQGHAALATLELRDSAHEVAAACAGLPSLVRQHVPPGGDWYSMVSALGFDVATGEVACEASTSGWQLRTNGQPFRDDWLPYRAFEPLEFLARGVCWRERP
ncbi:MAG: hypothetical protein IT361_04400 [Gemmatimonadaceae bacterium]|nr:hypothetical protein [Gemmatimonadaceae bacterium]